MNLDSFVLGPELLLRQMNARSAHDGGRDLSKERAAILSPLQPIANMPRDTEDLERIRNAIRSGVQPTEVQMKDPTTRRGLHPAIIAYEADGSVLELAKHGRVTRLGRLWDQERARSRSPVR